MTSQNDHLILQNMTRTNFWQNMLVVMSAVFRLMQLIAEQLCSQCSAVSVATDTAASNTTQSPI